MIHIRNTKSRRATGYTSPTKTRQEKDREEYDKKRAKREKCRKTNPDASTCGVCPFEHVCPSESTEDWINSQKEKEEPPE